MPVLGIKRRRGRKHFPKREKNGYLAFEDLSEFKPNVTPAEVLQAGAFGGTYFRGITSAVTNLSYEPDEVLADTVKDEWIDGLNKNV